MSDVWSGPTGQAWARSVLADMAPKMAASALVCSLIPDDGVGDVKFWVELGASIMMDKPIIAVLFGDDPCPAKLLAVADEIVCCPHGVDPAASAELRAAMARVMDRLSPR